MLGELFCMAYLQLQRIYARVIFLLVTVLAADWLGINRNVVHASFISSTSYYLLGTITTYSAIYYYYYK